CKLNMDDYVDVISLMEKPYFTQMEYKVPDNWWHDSSYYNVPLDTFMAIIKRGIRAGYSITIGGDVSEPGFNMNNVCMVPSFDIPSEYIDENARQFRFNNGTTTDDHGMHLVGYMEKNGKDWYLIKDSGAGSRNVGESNESFGYYYFHEDYVKLKIIDITVHKDLIKNLWNQFPTHFN
ncbi:MAG: C1 family peptidase, partial [Bacteroidota bacterium]